MIPKILHAWWGGPEMPPHLVAYLDEWRRLHPGWQFRLWTPETTPHLGELQDLYDAPERVSPKSNPWQWKSDLARYRILHTYGGVYVDADLEPLRPVDDLLTSEAFIAEEGRGFINNAFMGSTPGSSWMADVLAGLRASVLAQPRARSNRQIGAHFLTKVARRHPELTVLPTELVYPFHWSELDQRDRPAADDAYTRHHWHNKTKQVEGEVTV